MKDGRVTSAESNEKAGIKRMAVVACTLATGLTSFDVTAGKTDSTLSCRRALVSSAGKGWSHD